MLTRMQQNCWNESAAAAKCDPNADDACLCGPFFDAVTTCVSTTCSMGESLRQYLPITVGDCTDFVPRGSRHPGTVMLAAFHKLE